MKFTALQKAFSDWLDALIGRGMPEYRIPKKGAYGKTVGVCPRCMFLHCLCGMHY